MSDNKSSPEGVKSDGSSSQQHNPASRKSSTSADGDQQLSQALLVAEAHRLGDNAPASTTTNTTVGIPATPGEGINIPAPSVNIQSNGIGIGVGVGVGATSAGGNVVVLPDVPSTTHLVHHATPLQDTQKLRDIESLQEQLIAVKMQLYQAQENQQIAAKKEKKALDELEGERKKSFALESALKRAEADMKKLKEPKPDSLSKGFSKVFGKDREVEVAVADAKRQAAQTIDELREQNEALRAGSKHLHAENQRLAEELNALRAAFTQPQQPEQKESSNGSADGGEAGPVEGNAADTTSTAQPESLPKSASNLSREAVGGTPVPSVQALLECVEKKDVALRQQKDEFDRLLFKLSETDRQLLQAREQIENLERAAKGEQARLQAAAAQAGLGKAKAEQSKTLTEALAETNSKAKQFEEKVMELREKLLLTEKSLRDTQNLLQSTEDMCASQKAKIQELTSNLEHIKKDAEEQVEAVKEEAAQFKTFHENRWTQAKKEWEASVAGLKAEVKQAQQDADAARTALLALQKQQAEHDRATQQFQAHVANLTSELEAAKVELQNLQGSMHDSKEESKIEEKKRNRMVFELKAQLRKDALRVKELEAALAEKEDALATAQQSLKRAVEDQLVRGGGSSGTGNGGSGSGTPASSAGRTKTLRKFSSSGASIQALMSGNSPAKLSPSPSSSNILSVAASPDPALTGPEGEVFKALNKKVEDAQSENHVLKNKCQYLERTVRSLNEDLLEKRSVITNLLRRIESGALTTSETVEKAKQAAQTWKGESLEMREELFCKMDITLKETILENISLKENLKKMGAEVTRLMQIVSKLEEDNSALQSRLAALTGSVGVTGSMGAAAGGGDGGALAAVHNGATSTEELP